MASQSIEHTLIHNPGYDFLRLLNWMDQIDPQNPDLPFGPYFIVTIALLSACFALEGYTNMVGQKLDENWSEFDKGLVPIKDRIKRIYEIKNKEIDFGKGVWQKVLKLFKTRVSLVHPKYVKVTRENEAPDLFQEIQQKYTVTQIKQIIETAIDTLLSETGLDNLKDVYHMRFYSGPPRE